MDYSGMSGIPLIAREPTGAGAAVVMQGKQQLRQSVKHALVYLFWGRFRRNFARPLSLSENQTEKKVK